MFEKKKHTHSFDLLTNHNSFRPNSHLHTMSAEWEEFRQRCDVNFFHQLLSLSEIFNSESQLGAWRELFGFRFGHLNTSGNNQSFWCESSFCKSSMSSESVSAGPLGIIFNFLICIYSWNSHVIYAFPSLFWSQSDHKSWFICHQLDNVLQARLS